MKCDHGSEGCDGRGEKHFCRVMFTQPQPSTSSEDHVSSSKWKKLRDFVEGLAISVNPTVMPDAGRILAYMRRLEEE